MRQNPEQNTGTIPGSRQEKRFLPDRQGSIQRDHRPSIYIDIKDLSRHLKIKTSTLYAWVAQRKIPFVKIHGLIRFRIDEIDRWVESFREEKRHLLPIPPVRKSADDIDALIARAKREVYTSSHGETGPKSSLIGKEGTDGAR